MTHADINNKISKIREELCKIDLRVDKLKYMFFIVLYNSQIKLLYEYMNRDCDDDTLMDDVSYGALTDNVGLDGFTYLWFADGIHCCMINTTTLEIIDDGDKIGEIMEIVKEWNTKHSSLDT